MKRLYSPVVGVNSHLNRVILPTGIMIPGRGLIAVLPGLAWSSLMPARKWKLTPLPLPDYCNHTSSCGHIHFVSFRTSAYPARHLGPVGVRRPDSRLTTCVSQLPRDASRTDEVMSVDELRKLTVDPKAA